MIVVAAFVMLALGVFMLIIARPKGDQIWAPFLEFRYAEVTYAMIVTTFIGLGLTGTLGGILALVSG